MTMEQTIFAMLTNEEERNVEAVQASLYRRIALGAPWCFW